MINDWANPSSEHDFGFELMNKVKDSRRYIADFFGVSSRSIFFTSGATESINSVLSFSNLTKNNVRTIISSKLEHHATLDTLKRLEKSGFNVLNVSSNQSGQLDINELEDFLKKEKNALVSLLYVNNETGVISDIPQISRLCKKYDALIHIDAVQALGKMNFNLEDLEVDFASFAGHKIGALKGVGLLYIKSPKTYEPLMTGGGQEGGVRPGTYNYPGIKSFELALRDINPETIESICNLRADFEKQIVSNTSFAINCVGVPRVANTTNIYLNGHDSRAVLLNLSRKNIMVSSGSACSSGSFEPSHVIRNLGFDKEYASSCLRVSIGGKTTREELASFLNELLVITSSLSD